jgi:hypothetical protein
MAGESDALVLAARVVDQFSPTLKQLQRSLRSLSAETNAFHKGGIVQSKSHAESLLQLEVGNVAERMKSGLTPALAGLGISGLSAAAGITAIAASIKEFADTSRHLGIMTRQTALTVDQLRTLERLAPRIGTTAEQMDQALAQFNSHMEKLQRAPLTELRETFESLGVAARPETVTAWRNLVGSMQGLPRSEQLAKVIEFLDKVRDIGQKKIVLQAFGLPSEFASPHDERAAGRYRGNQVAPQADHGGRHREGPQGGGRDRRSQGVVAESSRRDRRRLRGRSGEGRTVARRLRVSSQ